jgi:hypothetical protein
MSFLTLLIFLHSLTCDLIQPSKNIEHEYNISVSKFCCPVCWELLEVLSETNNNLKFVVRTHHPHLYAVHLPRGLPDDALKKMIERFRKKLYEKLCQLPSVLPPIAGPGHYRNVSLESAGESVSSAGSTDAAVILKDHNTGTRLNV